MSGGRRGGRRAFARAAIGAGLLVAVVAWPARAQVGVLAAEPLPADEGLVRNLVETLEHADSEYRRLAAEELGDHPELAAQAGAAPVLVQLALDDPELAVREAALWTLGDLGPAARDDALPALWTLTDWQLPQPGRVQGIAAWAAARIDPPVDEAAKRLVPLTIHYDEFTRAAAADAMGELGAPMLPFLLLALANQAGSGSAAYVVDAIGAMGEAAAPAVPVLLELRAGEDSAWVLRSIDRALAEIGAPVPETVVDDKVAELAAELGQGPDYSKRVAAYELEELGPAAAAAAPALYAALEDPEVASDALEALLAVVPEEELPAAVEAGKPLLATPSWDGYGVAVAFAGAGEAGRAALVEGLSDPRVEVRRNALAGLAELPPGKDTFRPVRRLLSDPDAEVRGAAAEGLACYGERAVPMLDRAIRKERDATVEIQMVRALGGAGPRAIPTLERALGDERQEVREAAAWAAGELGQDALPLVPALLDAAGRDGVLSEAVGAVEKIGPAATPDLLEALAGHAVPGVRADAALALGRLEAPPEQVVPALARALDDESEDVRQWAAFALQQQGPAAAPAVEDLRAALTDPEPWVRQNAAQALGAIGEAAHPAIPDLVAVLEHDRSLTPPEKAAEALGSFGPAAAEAVGPLTRAVADEDNTYKRTAAARALIEIGITSPEVKAALRDALDDPKARVRWAAGDALLVLGDPDDVVSAMVTVRKAPDEAWDEDMAAIKEFNRMYDSMMEE